MKAKKVKQHKAPLLTDAELPEGWQWFEFYGRTIFESRDSGGNLRYELVAIMFDPSDEQLAADGSFTEAEVRGTAKILKGTYGRS